MTEPKLDQSRLTEEQRRSLETYQQAEEQLTTLGDIAAMVQDISNQLDKKDDIQKLGTLLVDLRESLAALNDKEAPETPDYAKPVVEAVHSLEKALSTSIKGIDVKPQVNLDAPQVNVSPPNVDLKGVEKVLKGELPKAFKSAVDAIKIPEVPKTDFQPLLDAWSGISEQLVSIENATRMKPIPGTMKVTNPDGTVISTGLVAGRDFDALDVDATSSTVDTLTYTLNNNTVQTVTVTYTGSSVDKISDTFDNLEFA